MSAPRPTFSHEALFYDDLPGFLAGTVPFLEAGIAGGEPALVAVEPVKVEALAQRVGAEWILTTEKDAVRLESLITSKWWAYLPHTAHPGAGCESYLLDRLREVRR